MLSVLRDHLVAYSVISCILTQFCGNISHKNLESCDHGMVSRIYFDCAWENITHKTECNSLKPRVCIVEFQNLITLLTFRGIIMLKFKKTLVCTTVLLAMGMAAIPLYAKDGGKSGSGSSASSSNSGSGSSGSSSASSGKGSGGSSASSSGQGSSGSSGSAGTSGSAGSSGSAGTSGTAGTSSSAGTSGTSGTSGSSGSSNSNSNVGRGRGADDLVGHKVRKGRGADDLVGHVRQGRGADDAVGHVRGADHADGHIGGRNRSIQDSF